jgi:YgiT-type zinc finger domain-containing protein
VATGFQGEEGGQMNCRVCGGAQRAVTTDLPFKVTAMTIVALKDLPVHQCGNCAEYSLDDQVVARVGVILAEANLDTELEVIRFAAERLLA